MQFVEAQVDLCRCGLDEREPVVVGGSLVNGPQPGASLRVLEELLVQHHLHIRASQEGPRERARG